MPVEIECQECGDTFEVPPSRADVRKHCSRECQYSHRTDSDKKVTLECKYCGDSFEMYSSRVGNGRGTYCSEKCLYEDQKARVSKECKHCGDIFEVQEWRKDQKYCSRECSAKGKNEQVTLICEYCNDEFTVPKSLKDEAKYCDSDCFGKDTRGKDNPVWKENTTRERGTGWEIKRDEAIERDNYSCQLCGISDDAHQVIFGRSLGVHHVTPYRINEYNGLDNLLTLCKSCHARLEGKTHREPDPTNTTNNVE